ncbi:MAG: hypothetical protein HY313_03105 [Acidobacteria bacterium]|nr:hypothetical protein [Acidobacteriota bacterium]
MPVTSSAADGLEQLLSLEEKIHQTIALLKSARMEKEGLLRENERLRREREEQENLFRTMESRLAGLEKERETVRARVQKLLELVDSLTKQSSES